MQEGHASEQDEYVQRKEHLMSEHKSTNTTTLDTTNWDDAQRLLWLFGELPREQREKLEHIGFDLRGEVPEAFEEFQKMDEDARTRALRALWDRHGKGPKRFEVNLNRTVHEYSSIEVIAPDEKAALGMVEAMEERGELDDEPGWWERADSDYEYRVEPPRRTKGLEDHGDAA